MTGTASTNNSLILLSVVLLLGLIGQSLGLDPLPTSKVFGLELLADSRLPVSLEHTFSENSEVTVAVSSCTSPGVLARTLNSFFHYNTYPIHQMLIFEGCIHQEQQIWGLLPLKSKEMNPSVIQIFLSKTKKKDLPQFQRILEKVKTKYLFYLSHSWMQNSTYGLIERMLDVLQTQEAKGKNISQVITTFPQWNSKAHAPLKMQRTQHGTRFYQLAYNDQFADKAGSFSNAYSLDPHLVNTRKLFSQVLQSSIPSSIGARYGCKPEQNECLTAHLGQFLSKIGYRQLYLELNQGHVFENIKGNIEQAQNIQKKEDVAKLDDIFANYEEKQQLQKQLQQQQQKKSQNKPKSKTKTVEAPANIKALTDQVQNHQKYQAIILVLLLIIAICCVIKSIVMLLSRMIGDEYGDEDEQDEVQRYRMRNVSKLKRRYHADDDENEEEEEERIIYPQQNSKEAIIASQVSGRKQYVV